ncbi:MAG: 3-keto-disaccharide hydrolase [Acidobacteriaceae bacterium]
MHFTRKASLPVVVLSIAILMMLAQRSLLAQSYPLAPPPPPQSYPTPFVESDAGFTPIFDGKTLHGWDGDPKYWHVENGEIVGEVTPQTLLKQNSFLIWRGGKPANFELIVEFRISRAGNSGINYRSVEIPHTKWLLRGYQADIDAANKYTGQNYEERGRTFLAERGQMTHIVTGKPPAVIGSLGTADELKSFIKPGEWNRYHIIARGNVLIHILNGHVMSEVIDDDTANRKFSGLIGVQVHVGPPMKIEYRKFLLKTLP